MARASNLTMCSFCGKSHAEVRKLIAGPGVYICDSCINVCKGILDKELNEDAKRQSTTLRVPKPVEIRRALALQHAPVLVMTHQGNLIAKWPRRVIHETTSARARPTSGQTRSNAVNTTPHSLFVASPFGDAFHYASCLVGAVIVAAIIPTGPFSP